MKPSKEACEEAALRLETDGWGYRQPDAVADYLRSLHEPCPTCGGTGRVPCPHRAVCADPDRSSVAPRCPPGWQKDCTVPCPDCASCSKSSNACEDEATNGGAYLTEQDIRALGIDPDGGDIDVDAMLREIHEALDPLSRPVSVRDVGLLLFRANLQAVHAEAGVQCVLDAANEEIARANELLASARGQVERFRAVVEAAREYRGGHRGGNSVSVMVVNDLRRRKLFDALAELDGEP